jgi:hypothetical protein
VPHRSQDAFLCGAVGAAFRSASELVTHPHPVVPIRDGLFGLPVRVADGLQLGQWNSETVLPRPDDKVPVVAQDAPGQNPRRRPRVRFQQHPLKRRLIRLLAEQRQPGYRPVQDMIDVPARSHSGCSWHELKTNPTRAACQQLAASPFRTPRFVLQHYRVAEPGRESPQALRALTRSLKARKVRACWWNGISVW